MAFNKIILIGNMTADPELKQTQGGTSVCSFTIAVNRRYVKEGEQKVDYINIVAWKEHGEFVSRYFKKGNPILICGQLQTRSWNDNQGQKRYTTEVVADEVSFVAPANQNEQKPPHTPPLIRHSERAKSGLHTAPNPQSFQNGSYAPGAYAGAENPQFGEIPNDEQLPF